MHSMLHTVGANMFQLSVPLLEKIVRPIVMYVVLIVFLRLFGKRELAQLNPFDLVVLLTLANTVQNAIIGNDNSVTGGVIGAFALLSMNWLVMALLYRMPRLTEGIQGSAATLICDGQVDDAALEAEKLTHDELVSVLNRNGFTDPHDVALCRLDPNGTFFVKGRKPSTDDFQRGELMHALERLTAEVRELQRKLDAAGHD